MLGNILLLVMSVLMLGYLVAAFCGRKGFDDDGQWMVSNSVVLCY